MTRTGHARVNAAIDQAIRALARREPVGQTLRTLLSEYDRIKDLDQREPPRTVPGFPPPVPGPWSDEDTKPNRRIPVDKSKPSG